MPHTSSTATARKSETQHLAEQQANKHARLTAETRTSRVGSSGSEEIAQDIAIAWLYDGLNVIALSMSHDRLCDWKMCGRIGCRSENLQRVSLTAEMVASRLGVGVAVIC